MLSIFFIAPFLQSSTQAQEAQPEQAQASKEIRKIVRKTSPHYPEIARRMNLDGTVKLIATVAPDGKVTSVQPMGGSPLLIQAGQDAIAQWKFAPAGAESKEVIELHFNLHTD
jgi:TonB family protein